MTAAEAKSYGIIDRVLTSRPDLEFEGKRLQKTLVTTSRPHSVFPRTSYIHHLKEAEHVVFFLTRLLMRNETYRFEPR